VPTKKVFALAGTFIFIVVSPFIFLSGGMMGCYQRKIDQSPQTQSSKDWQFRLGKICASTMRPALAADMFGKFIDRYEKDPRRPEAMWRRAECYRDLENTTEAKEAYRRLAVSYPEDPYGQKADQFLQTYYKDYIR